MNEPVRSDIVVYGATVNGSPFPIREIRGEEGVSRPFRFELRFRNEDNELLDPEQLAGQLAAILIERGGRLLRRLPGVITEASISATATGAAELSAVVEPRLALLRYRSNCRVFRDMSVPEIVAKVLDESHIDCRLELRGDYPKRPYCVQFRETDLDFVQRLLEDEGIFYVCRDVVEPEGKREHVVLLGDGPWGYEPIPGDAQLPWRPASEMRRSEESVHEIAARSALTPGKVMLRDWNLEKPSLPMEVVADVARGAPAATWYDHPGKYELPQQGQRKARLVAEAFACAAHVVEGAADVPRLACGRSFELSDGPPGLEPAYAVLSLTHVWQRESEAEGPQLSLRFSALPANVGYRPPRRTPVPLIAAPLTGFVTGPEGEDIHTDELGRVKLHFPWDRYQPRDDNSSHWIPVLQENTGQSSTVPRVGWEMLVDFVEGDPDRPYVLGRVYNGTDRFPEPLPDNKTKSALRSLSSPGRDGQNQIWMDDLAGSELMAIQAERDQNVVAANDKNEDVLNTEANTIVKDETIVIGNDQTITVGDKHSLNVKGNQTIEVGGSRSRDVGESEEVAVTGARSMTIGSSHMRTIGGFDNVGAESIGEKIGAVAVEMSLKKNATAAAMFDALTVGGAVIELAGSGKTEETQMLRVETIGGILYSGVKTLFSLGVDQKRSTTVGASLMAKAVDVTLKAGTTLLAKLAGQADLAGAEAVVVKSGGSEVTLAADGIAMKSDKTITIKADGAAALLSDRAELRPS